MKRLWIAITLLIASSFAVAADDQRIERVSFETGASEAAISDSLTGYQFVDYLLGARAGQMIRVDLNTDNASNYFNLYVAGTSPDTDEAAFIGSISGNAYTGVIPSDGDVTLRVYLMRNAARRDETARYTLTVGIK